MNKERRIIAENNGKDALKTKIVAIEKMMNSVLREAINTKDKNTEEVYKNGIIGNSNCRSDRVGN